MTYSLCIEILGDRDEYHALYSKGHHTAEAFKQAVADHQGCKLDEVAEPQHGWWRWRPAQAGEEYRYWQMDAEAGARGAFPVTFIYC
jgi:hypothetical protein